MLRDYIDKIEGFATLLNVYRVRRRATNHASVALGRSDGRQKSTSRWSAREDRLAS